MDFLRLLCGVRNRFSAMWCSHFVKHAHRRQSGCWYGHVRLAERCIDDHIQRRADAQATDAHGHRRGCRPNWSRCRATHRRRADRVCNLEMVSLQTSRINVCRLTRTYRCFYINLPIVSQTTRESFLRVRITLDAAPCNLSRKIKN